MKLLAIETSTESCSCALCVEGEIAERSTMALRRHAELILPMADELLGAAGLIPSQLDAVAFGRGPGSFTGLRIACGVAQGIAFAANLPLIPVSSLATLAQGAYLEYQAQRVLAMIDARMQEIYWGCYAVDANGIMREVGEEKVSAPDTVILPTAESWYAVGSGWVKYGEKLKTRLHSHVDSFAPDKYPQACAMIPLALAAYHEGKTVTAEQAVPVYLRNQVTHS